MTIFPTFPPVIPRITTRPAPLFACLAGLLVSLSQTTRGEIVYDTGFDTMTPAAALAGQDGWLEYDGPNSQGVDEFSGGGDNYAWIGYTPPTNPDGAAVYRPVNIDPVASGQPIVRFEVSFQIVDSSEGPDDTFSWSFFNQSGELLGSIDFDLAELGIFQDDTVDYWDLDTEFAPGQWYGLDVLADFERSTWTAFLFDHETEEWITLFTDVDFHAGTSTLNLGDIDATWIVNDPSEAPGDNYMIFDDYTIRTLNRREAWYAEWFGIYEDEIDPVKDDDDDGDGFSLDEEFAFGGNPNISDAAAMPFLAGRHLSGADSFLTVSFNRQMGSALGITYQVEETGSLAAPTTWSPLPLPGNLVGTTPLDGPWETAEVHGNRMMSGPGANPHGFLRVHIVPDP